MLSWADSLHSRIMAISQRLSYLFHTVNTHWTSNWVTNDKVDYVT